MHSPLMMSFLRACTVSMKESSSNSCVRSRLDPAAEVKLGGRKDFGRHLECPRRCRAVGGSRVPSGERRTGRVELAHVVVEDVEFVRLEKGHGEVFPVFTHFRAEHAHVIDHVVSDEPDISAAEVSHAGFFAEFSAESSRTRYSIGFDSTRSMPPSPDSTVSVPSRNVMTRRGRMPKKV